MKFLCGLFIIIMSISTVIFAEEGICLPGYSTPDYQAPYCRLSKKNGCELIGCEWKVKTYSCRPGNATPSYQVPYCHLSDKQGCTVIGCEWVGVYR